ncbi:MAG TPA: sensor histidine kinase [Burkholderiales bacterium]
MRSATIGHVRLRSSLVTLVVATVVPLVLFAALVTVFLVRYERDNFVQAMNDRNRAFLSAVDAELKGQITSLHALAASRGLAVDDLRAFHDDASAVLRTQTDWLNVVLTAPGGRQLVNARAPWGSRLRATPVQPDTLARVADTLAPVVGNVAAPGAIVRLPGIPVRVPILRKGALVYVLTAIVDPDVFQRLIVSQQLPSGWVSGLVDASGKFVARVPPQPIGSPASAQYLARQRSQREGFYRGTTVEGIDTYTAYGSSDFSGWSVGLAIPASAVLGGAVHAAWMMAAGVIVFLAIAIGIALWLARRIAGPIEALASAAPALGTAAARVRTRTAVKELQQLAWALDGASHAIRERGELLVRERDALRSADRAKQEFLAMLSHELRNPLAAIANSAYLLKSAGTDREMLATAQRVIERQTQHMKKLVDELIDVSGIAMGKAKLELEPLDVAELVSRLVEGWRHRLGNHDVRLSAAPVWVKADRRRLEQVVSNLLDNAAKYTPAHKAITVHVGGEGGTARIVVQDEGIGIAPADLERVFDLFAQADQGLSRSGGGIGVGLAVVKRVVEMHGGTVVAESAGPGSGSRFTVNLPAVEAPDAERAAA